MALLARRTQGVGGSLFCPDDRELAYRGQIKQGWSTVAVRHQSHRGNMGDTGLSQEEWRHIQEVCSRAEAIERTEEIRIGVQMLQFKQLSTNARGDGASSCVLCGLDFLAQRSRRPAPILMCQLCGKAMCSRCKVTSRDSSGSSENLCRLCHEERELWKKSGAWLFNTLPFISIPAEELASISHQQQVTRRLYPRIESVPTEFVSPQRLEVEEDSGPDSLPSSTGGSYSNLYWNEGPSSRPHTPAQLIDEITSSGTIPFANTYPAGHADSYGHAGDAQKCGETDVGSSRLLRQGAMGGNQKKHFAALRDRAKRRRKLEKQRDAGDTAVSPLPPRETGDDDPLRSPHSLPTSSAPSSPPPPSSSEDDEDPRPRLIIRQKTPRVASIGIITLNSSDGLGPEPQVLQDEEEEDEKLFRVVPAVQKAPPVGGVSVLPTMGPPHDSSFSAALKPISVHAPPVSPEPPNVVVIPVTPVTEDNQQLGKQARRKPVPSPRQRSRERSRERSSPVEAVDFGGGGASVLVETQARQAKEREGRPQSSEFDEFKKVTVSPSTVATESRKARHRSPSPQHMPTSSSSLANTLSDPGRSRRERSISPALGTDRRDRSGSNEFKKTNIKSSTLGTIRSAKEQLAKVSFRKRSASNDATKPSSHKRTASTDFSKLSLYQHTASADSSRESATAEEKISPDPFPRVSPRDSSPLAESRKTSTSSGVSSAERVSSRDSTPLAEFRKTSTSSGVSSPERVSSRDSTPLAEFRKTSATSSTTQPLHSKPTPSPRSRGEKKDAVSDEFKKVSQGGRKDTPSDEFNKTPRSESKDKTLDEFRKTSLGERVRLSPRPGEEVVVPRTGSQATAGSGLGSGDHDQTTSKPNTSPTHAPPDSLTSSVESIENEGMFSWQRTNARRPVHGNPRGDSDGSESSPSRLSASLEGQSPRLITDDITHPPSPGSSVKQLSKESAPKPAEPVAVTVELVVEEGLQRSHSWQRKKAVRGHTRSKKLDLSKSADLRPSHGVTEEVETGEEDMPRFRTRSSALAKDERPHYRTRSDAIVSADFKLSHQRKQQNFSPPKSEIDLGDEVASAGLHLSSTLPSLQLLERQGVGASVERGEGRGTRRAVGKTDSLPMGLKGLTIAEHGLFGSIEFSTAYSAEKSTLTVTIEKCNGLRPMDSNGLSDPYVVVAIIPSHKSHRFRTVTIYKQLNPKFYQQFTFQGITAGILEEKALGLIVMDHDLIGQDDLIGGVKVPLYEVDRCEQVSFTRLLGGGDEVSSFHDEIVKDKGRLLLSISYSDEMLKVFVKKAVDLVPVDKREKANPTVKCMVMSGGQLFKLKTKPQTRTLNPVYNELLTFAIPHQDLPKSSLTVVVTDHSRVAKSVTIGEMTIGVKAFWSKLSSSPDYVHEEWYMLQKPASW